MRIVIAGAGKLGFSIAQLLAEDQFDVVVVELDAKRKGVSRTRRTFWRLKAIPAARRRSLTLMLVMPTY